MIDSLNMASRERDIGQIYENQIQKRQTKAEETGIHIRKAERIIIFISQSPRDKIARKMNLILVRVNALNRLLQFSKTYKTSGFTSALMTAKELCYG